MCLDPRLSHGQAWCPNMHMSMGSASAGVDLQSKARAVLTRPAIIVGAMVAAGLHELVDYVPDPKQLPWLSSFFTV